MALAVAGLVAASLLGAGSAHGASLDGAVGGAVTYVAANGVSNQLTVSFDGANYTFIDATDLISADGTVCTGGGAVGAAATCPAVVTSISVDLGDRDDRITVASTAVPTSLTGGPGDDRVIASGDGGFTLTNASLSATTSAFPFLLSGFQNATLSGGSGANSFDVSGWDAGPVELNAGPGTDTLIDDLSTGGTGFALSDSSLVRLGGPTFWLAGFDGETANLTGGAGDDLFTISGWSGSGTLSGGASADSLVSANNASIQTITDSQLTRDASVIALDSITFASLTGGPSVNRFDASARSTGVTLSAGNGNDVLIGTGSDDTISGGGGTDRLIEQRDADVTLTNSQFASGAENDSLSSIERATITGGAGDQTIDASGFGGPVDLSGEGGRDTLLGGSSADTLAGGPGEDTLTGANGSDTLEGGPGDDTLGGGSGTDVMRAVGITNGVLSPGTFTDPALGNDTHTGMNRAELIGTSGADVIDASAWAGGTVTASGLAGDDDIRGGAGWDVLTGAAGNDTITGNGGTDTLTETLTTAGTLSLSNTTVEGSLGNDSIDGFERARINGSAGPDALSAAGWTGQVTLDGQAGADTYTIGLAGAGLFSLLDSGNSTGDTARVIAGPTADSVQVTATQIARGAETVGLSSIEGQTVDLGGGNDSATILGGHGVVIGGAGDDTISIEAVSVWGLTADGGEGSDAVILTFGNLAGVTAINDSGSAGTDSLSTNCAQPLTLTPTSASLGGETATFSGIELAPCTAPPAPPSKGTPATPKLKPSKLRCTIRGTKKNDVLRGTKKRDVICGFKGDDIILGLRGNDVLIGGPGSDILDGGPGRDELQGDRGRDTLIGGRGVDRLFGGGGRDAAALATKKARKLRVSVERTLRGAALRKTLRKISRAARTARAG